MMTGQTMPVVPTEAAVVLVFDASPTPESWLKTMWEYTRQLMTYFTANNRLALRVRIPVHSKAKASGNIPGSEPQKRFLINHCLLFEDWSNHLWSSGLVRNNSPYITYHSPDTVLTARCCYD